MLEIGASVTDGYQWGKVIDQDGVMIRIKWDYPDNDTRQPEKWVNFLTVREA